MTKDWGLFKWFQCGDLSLFFVNQFDISKFFSSLSIVSSLSVTLKY